MRSVLYKEYLYSLRVQNGWSLEAAGTKCSGTDKKSYWRWETGLVSRPSKRNLELIAKAFGLASTEALLLKPGQIPDPTLKARWQLHYLRGEELNSTTNHSGPVHVVIFDLDGTLLRGMEFSWKEVWAHIPNGESQRISGFRRYRKGELNYAEWCQYCVERFNANGIVESKMRRIARENAFLAPEFYDVIQKIRGIGIKTAIVSGGISTFLEELIPDYRQYFDLVFINTLSFDHSGKISHVEPTPYDFERKADGICHICKMLETDPQHSIFVGDAFNDESAAYVAGMTISIGNSSQLISQIFHHKIENGSLQRILDYIIQS